MEQVYKAGGDIRFVMTTSCQSGCDFCHLEGHKSTEENGTLNEAIAGWKSNPSRAPLLERLGTPIQSKDVEATIEIAQRMGLTQVHLTGGEPTLHPQLFKIIAAFQDAGLSVSLTTHGEFGKGKLKKLLESGITGINFSLHAMTPQQYLAMDIVAQQLAQSRDEAAALKYARTRLKLKHQNMQAAATHASSSELFSVKANCVVLSEEVALQIVRWCNTHGIKIRLQRDLNNPAVSSGIIQTVIHTLSAEVQREELATGDSSGSGTLYTYPDGEFKVKHFGDIYIDEMCNGCAKKDTPDCRERFYGLRIEQGKVVTCIDHQVQSKTHFSFAEFLEQLNTPNTTPHSIAASYATMQSN